MDPVSSAWYSERGKTDILLLHSEALQPCAPPLPTCKTTLLKPRDNLNKMSRRVFPLTHWQNNFLRRWRSVCRLRYLSHRPRTDPLGRRCTDTPTPAHGVVGRRKASRIGPHFFLPRDSCQPKLGPPLWRAGGVSRQD